MIKKDTSWWLSTIDIDMAGLSVILCACFDSEKYNLNWTNGKRIELERIEIIDDLFIKKKEEQLKIYK